MGYEPLSIANGDTENESATHVRLIHERRFLITTNRTLMMIRVPSPDQEGRRVTDEMSTRSSWTMVKVSFVEGNQKKNVFFGGEGD